VPTLNDRFWEPGREIPTCFRNVSKSGEIGLNWIKMLRSNLKIASPTIELEVRQLVSFGCQREISVSRNIREVQNQGLEYQGQVS